MSKIRQTPPQLALSLLVPSLMLAACASSGNEPQQEREVAQQQVAGDGVLPPALMRAAYNAPEWTGDPAGPKPTGATQQPARQPYQSQAYQPQAYNVPEVEEAPESQQDYYSEGPYAVVPATEGPIKGEAAPRTEVTRAPVTQQNAAPVALSYADVPTVEEAPVSRTASATPRANVPAAPSMSQQQYQPQTDVSQLDPVYVTDSRAPRANASGAQPVTTTTPSPSAQQSFSGETVSVMPQVQAAPTRPAVASEARTAPLESRSTPATGTHALHLASYRRMDDVERGWEIYQERHGDVLAGLQARGVAVSIPGKGEYIRLLIGPFSTPSDAKAMCAELLARDEYCNIVPFSGTPIL